MYIRSLLICLIFGFVLNTYALLKSTTKGKGFFIQVKKYDPALYGTVPFAVDYEYLPNDLLAEGVNTIPSHAPEMLNLFESKSKRTRVYEQRRNMINFLASKVLDDFTCLSESPVEVLWISPLIYVKDDSLLESVQNEINRSNLVEKIINNDIVASVSLVGNVPEQHSHADPGDVVLAEKNRIFSWGLKKINVEAIWKLTKGKQVRVGIIDTGVQYLHYSLSRSYQGFNERTGQYKHNFNWFDPREFRDDEWWCDPDFPCLRKECCLDEPFDNVGHGSHVASTIAGTPFSNGTHEIVLGVAPESKWIAAKGCRDGNCLRYGLLKSAEWMACPAAINSTKVDCDQGADVINNSWGSKSSTDDFYKDVVQVWSQMEIIPVFAAGNNGPSCESMSAPGDFANVIGVAASNIDDQLVSFSSRGPGPKDGGGLFKRMKPDITAPGSKILGAAPTFGNDTIMTMSGTSMATPHMTGAVALILSSLRSKQGDSNGQRVLSVKKAPELSTAEALRISCDSALTSLGDAIGGGGRRIPFPGFPVRKECSGSDPHTWPNNVFYGCGRLSFK